MIHLTVGYVAGFIAAAIFVARLWSPNVLTFILSGVLRDSNSAATWTAASTAFQRSHWPWALQSDSARNRGVRKDILTLTWIISFMSFIIAIAGVVTPLGLHETLVPAENTETSFQYLEDTSPFGYGSPPRSNLPLNRRCQGRFADIPCPFSDTVAIEVTDSNWENWTYPYGYDISIPKSLTDTFSSGTGNDNTISNYFDIEWRRYQTTYDVKKTYNNGSNFLVGSVRVMQSMALNNAVEPVEGLLVDTRSGGIGFRNHTIPPGFPYGVSWQEDLLFIEPETVCVDTNTTIDYTISMSANSTVTIIDLALTDRGGFAELDQEYPLINLYDPQPDAKLYERAYKAAWMTNAYTMMYYNITTPNNGSTGAKAFSYLNSEVGKTFYIADQKGTGNYDSLSLSYKFESHLDLSGIYQSNRNDSNLPRPTNPFNLKSANFSDISLICSGAGSADYANLTNIYVNCGLMRGIPQRIDEGSSIIFDAGSRWSQPIYTCASAVKAIIKTVHFTYNGTDGLKSLVVDSVEPKKYADNSSKPLWGVEDSGNKYTMSQIQLIWGLISDEYKNQPNVSTLRQEYLYLPGYANKFGNTLESIGSQNLPASDFYPGAMGSAYSVGAAGTSFSSTTADYTGQTSMALWARWQNFTKNATTASRIPNLIFTDYAAAAVVGTKGILGPRNAAQKNMVPLRVTPTVSRIRYRLPFAIPAIIAVLGLILMTVAALITMIFHHHNIHKMRLQLQKLSPGRIFTTFLHPELGGMTVPSKNWSRSTGKTAVDISGDFPRSAGVIVGSYEKGPNVAVYEKSVSDDHSTERDQFLGGPGPIGQPQPYVGIEHLPVSPVPEPQRF